VGAPRHAVVTRTLPQRGNEHHERQALRGTPPLRGEKIAVSGERTRRGREHLKTGRRPTRLVGSPYDGLSRTQSKPRNKVCPYVDEDEELT